MNLMIQPNQICLIVKLYNNRPELLPDSNEAHMKIITIFVKDMGVWRYGNDASIV